MKTVWIGGNHPRHLYYVNTIAKNFPISGAIIQEREEHIPTPPADIESIDRENFIRHFANRAHAETRHFGIQPLPNCETLRTSKEEINSEQTVSFLKRIKPDVVIIFGCRLLMGAVAEALPAQTINMHLGLSPRYRGAATLFWPFYFMEPTYAGSTFHYIVDEPDAGDIVHQVTPTLSRGDGVHDVACNTVKQSAIEAVELLKIIERTGSLERYKQKGTGKNFLEKDFRPEHLRVLYNVFNDDMVEHYLDGRLSARKPKLIRQF